jgi:hypothetical protein
MNARLDPLAFAHINGVKPKKGFYKLDSTQNLSSLLRNRQFVEFPTIDVWDAGAFKGMVVDAQGGVQPETGNEEARLPKRRKLDRRAGTKAIHGLLGSYGSDDDELDENATEQRDVLAMLGTYSGSDDGEDDGLGDEDAEGDTDDGEDIEMDPAALLELMRQVRGTAVDEDDLVDWGDSEDDET